uniref:Neuropeptide n=1 Tax=Caenorhabditis tropicalis TaxID=1561998 RepID=A0A1I7TBY7_9PELO
MITDKCLLLMALLGLAAYQVNANYNSLPKKVFMEPGNIFNRIFLGQKNSDESDVEGSPIGEMNASGDAAEDSFEMPEKDDNLVLEKRIYINRQGFRPAKRSMAIGRAGMRPGKRAFPEYTRELKEGEQVPTEFQYWPFDSMSYFEVQ